MFTALADAAEWMVRQQGVEFVINYLDDFLVITVADEHQRSHAMQLLLETFEHLRLPPNSVEQAGRPVAMFDFSRVLLDSICREIRLPGQKLTEIRCEVHW